MSEPTFVNDVDKQKQRNIEHLNKPRPDHWQIYIKLMTSLRFVENNIVTNAQRLFGFNFDVEAAWQPTAQQVVGIRRQMLSCFMVQCNHNHQRKGHYKYDFPVISELLIYSQSLSILPLTYDRWVHFSFRCAIKILFNSLHEIVVLIPRFRSFLKIMFPLQFQWIGFFYCDPNCLDSKQGVNSSFYISLEYLWIRIKPHFTNIWDQCSVPIELKEKSVQI